MIKKKLCFIDTFNIYLQSVHVPKSFMLHIFELALDDNILMKTSHHILALKG